MCFYVSKDFLFLNLLLSILLSSLAFLKEHQVSPLAHNASLHLHFFFLWGTYKIISRDIIRRVFYKTLFSSVDLTELITMTNFPNLMSVLPISWL